MYRLYNLKIKSIFRLQSTNYFLCKTINCKLYNTKNILEFHIV